MTLVSMTAACQCLGESMYAVERFTVAMASLEVIKQLTRVVHPDGSSRHVVATVRQLPVHGIQGSGVCQIEHLSIVMIGQLTI